MIEDALLPLGVPYAANVYEVTTGQELPDLYLVYSVVSNYPEQAADDAETERTFRVQVSVYNRAGLTTLPDVSGQMVEAGFMKSRRTEIPYNRDTGHYGIAMEFTICFEEE